MGAFPSNMLNTARVSFLLCQGPTEYVSRSRRLPGVITAPDINGCNCQIRQAVSGLTLAGYLRRSQASSTTCKICTPSLATFMMHIGSLQHQRQRARRGQLEGRLTLCYEA